MISNFPEIADCYMVEIYVHGIVVLGILGDCEIPYENFMRTLILW